MRTPESDGELRHIIKESNRMENRYYFKRKRAELEENYKFQEDYSQTQQQQDEFSMNNGQDGNNQISKFIAN